MATERRDRGEGSIRQRSNGSWEGRYKYTDDITGKQLSKSVYASTKTEIKKKLKELIEKVENPLPEEEEYVKPTQLKFGEWLDTWMKEYKKNGVSPSTYTSYYMNIENHIRPALGDMAIQKIRPEHVQKLLNELTKGKGKQRPPMAPWSVIKVKNIISGAFEQAIRNQIVPYNPARAVIPPKMDQKEIRILTEDEQKKFLDVVKGHRLEALYVFALATGMRRGEILALSWDSVDLDNRNISVKGSVNRVKDPDTKVSQLIYSDPKTKSGKRQIPILPNLVQVLQDHKARQDEERRAAGSAWNPRNLVFCSNVGTVIEPRRVATTMNKMAEAAGLPHFTFHSLRHTFATRMMEAGVPAKVVQEVLGHADVTLTLNTYSHVVGSTAHEQMAKINGLFGSSGKGEPESEKPSVKEQMRHARQKVDNYSKKQQTEKSQKKKSSDIEH